MTEVKKATALLEGYEKFYVTFRLPHTEVGSEAGEYFYVIDPHLSLFKYLINFVQALWIYLKKRPAIIVTTGAGIVIPMCLVGKIFGSKIVFVETGARVSSPSRTGKLLYHLADYTLVQWEPLLKHFANAEYGGVLL